MRSLSNVIKPDQVMFSPGLEDEETAAGRDEEVEPRARRVSLVGRAMIDRIELLKIAKKEVAHLVDRTEEYASRQLEAAEAARERAVDLQEKARAEGHDAGFRQGRHEGYEAGFEAGRQEVLATFKEMLEAVESSVADLRDRQREVLDEVQDEVLHLAVAIAEKIVCERLQDAPETARSILKELLTKVDASSKALVRLPQAVIDSLGEEADVLLQSASADLAVKFVPDDSLAPGDVLIEADWGLIDGRLRTRWQRVMEGLDLVKRETNGTS